ncbi:MAG TPA: hypothetical protein VFC13_26605 [Actinomycetes bacterium]|nr:hypothetical protein [Actinomycetes bacterium]
MRSVVTAVQMAVRVLGVIQIVLGILFWTGNALGLVDLHMLNGILIVLLLWVMAGLAAAARVSPALAAGAFVWGLIVPIVGLSQTNLLTGSLHWLIQVIHLLLGIGLLNRADTLATKAKAYLAPVA